MDREQRIAFLKNHITSERYRKIRHYAELRTRYLTVVLEDIYYSQNLSAIIRTCDCLGIQDVHVIGRESAARINSTVALGSSKWVDTHRHTDTPKARVIALLKSNGYRIVATVPGDDSVPLVDFDIEAGPVALLFGRELPGLSEETIAAADERLKIPMYGFSDSFNISVSAGIILHHLNHRLRNSDIAWRISKDETRELIYRWVRSSTRKGAKLEEEYSLRLAHPNDQ